MPPSRFDFLEKLGNKCCLCNSNQKLEIHHRDRDIGNNELANLQLLCRSCHRNLHTILRWDGKKPRLTKIGNSVRMTIPMHLLRALNWKEGDIVDVGIKKGSMIVSNSVNSSPKVSSRLKKVKRLGSKCRVCGSTLNLEIHHIDRNRMNNDFENLQLYCRDCHREDHSRTRGVKVLMVDNSLKMTIPHHVVKKMNITKGDKLLVSMINGEMIVRKQG